MGALLDIILAAMVASMLVVNAVATNDQMLTMRHRNILQYALQLHSSELQQLLLRDLRMAGCGVDPGAGVIRADATALELRGDLLRDGVVHTVSYALGDSADATMTPHPRDRLLRRRVDGGAAEVFAYGLVDLRFTYLDSAGQVAASSSAVRQVHYRYALESPVPYGDDSPALIVNGSVTPKNLR